ncbi:MAG: SDR family NAD(P)-dependent oxidoreductase, partial [Desulfomonilia bacterium]|nr:SDR family NAD(P)-dependent oxidoreductase [Desulfomonilia bacterium]
YEAVKAFSREIHEGYGSLDILVNVAGVALFSQLEDMDHADWEKVMNVNLWGVIHGIECFVPEMIRARRGGHIVTVSSTAGLIGLPWHAAYAGSKHALVGISEVLRYDLKKHGIGVSVVCPGAVNTGMVETVDIHADPQAVSGLKKHFIRIAMSPEDVARLMVKAIVRNTFLVITSTDIKLLYFLKHHLFPLYHLIMRLATRAMDHALTRTSRRCS